MGFGRDDDEEGEEKEKQQHGNVDSHASGSGNVGSFVIDTDREVVVSEAQGVRLDLPSTPPPPLPSYPPAPAAAAAPSVPLDSLENFDAVLATKSVERSQYEQRQATSPSPDAIFHNTNVLNDPYAHLQLNTHNRGDTAEVSLASAEFPTNDKSGPYSSQVADSAPQPEPEPEPIVALPVFVPAPSPTFASAPTMEQARSAASAFAPVHSPAPVPALSMLATNASPAESSLQKLEQKSRENLLQLTRALGDLSRIHSSALAGQDRFRRG